MRTILIASLMTLATQVGAEKYICTSTNAVGFKMQNGTWNGVNFQDVQRYIINLYGNQATVTEFGDNEPFFSRCEYWEPYLGCSSGWSGLGQFKADLHHLRFMRSYLDGYYKGPQNTDTPYIEIGTCYSY